MFIARDNGDLVTQSFEETSWGCYSGMFDGGNNQMTARARRRFQQNAFQREIIAFGPAAREYDFLGIATDQIGDCGTGISDCLAGRPTHAMRAGRIPIMNREKGLHRLDHAGCHGGRRVVVEVDFPHARIPLPKVNFNQ